MRSLAILGVVGLLATPAWAQTAQSAPAPSEASLLDTLHQELLQDNDTITYLQATILDLKAKLVQADKTVPPPLKKVP
jgi:hypothetical protein